MKYINNRKIRWGLVGCGRISANHFKALQTFSEDVEIPVVCDVVADRGLSVQKSTGAVPVGSVEEMLRYDLDIVSLCTPSGLHADHTVFFANKGLHVLTEKPMATTWSDGLRMVKACDQNKTLLFVVKQNRFNPTLQFLKRAVDEGRFGKIYDISVNVFWTRGQDYYDQAPWRGTQLMDGGAFMNQASHYIDLLTWLGGPLSEIYSMTGTLARKIECEDTGVMSLRWKSGALGTLNVTMLTYPANLEGSITILGEKGTARIGGLAVNKVDVWKFADVREYDEQIHSANYETESVYGFGHAAYYKNVIDTLKGNSTPYVNGEEGLSSLETLAAAYQSASQRAPVMLPLER